jgi:hypothetical protein
VEHPVLLSKLSPSSHAKKKKKKKKRKDLETHQKPCSLVASLAADLAKRTLLQIYQSAAVAADTVQHRFC